MEMDEERKARLKKMVVTTQLRLVLVTEDERRARLEYLSDNPIYIPNNLYLINCRGVIINVVLFPPPFYLFFISQTSYHTHKLISSYELARPVMGTIFLV